MKRHYLLVSAMLVTFLLITSAGLVNSQRNSNIFYNSASDVDYTVPFGLNPPNNRIDRGMGIVVVDNIHVVSKTILKEYSRNGHMVQEYRTELRMERPSYSEIIKRARPVFRRMRRNYGVEKAKRVIKDYKKSFKSISENWPAVKTENLVMTRLIDPDENRHTVAFSENIYGSEDTSDVSDPVNLFFWDSGSAYNVDDIMNHDLDEDWGDEDISSDMWAIVDKGSAGGDDVVMKTQDYTLAITEWGPNYRWHIRIWNGGYDSDDWKNWSIAGVHKEDLDHDILSWEQAEDQVEYDFDDESFASVGQGDLGNAYYYQGHWNDGKIPVIRITEFLP